MRYLFILLLISGVAKGQTEGSLFTQAVSGAGDMRCFFPTGWSTAPANRQVLIYHWPGSGATTISAMEGEYPFKKIVDGWNGKKVIAPGDTVYYAVIGTVSGNMNCNNAVKHSDYIFSNWLGTDSTSMINGYRTVFSGYSLGGGEMSKPLTGFCFGGEEWEARVQRRYKKFILAATGTWQNAFDLDTILGKRCAWLFVDVDDPLANNTNDVYNSLLAAPGTTASSVKKTNPVLSGAGHTEIDDYTYQDGTNASNDVLWWAYDTIYGAPVSICGAALQKIPITEDKIRDFSGISDKSSLFYGTAGGGVLIDQAFKVADDPINGIYAANSAYDATEARPSIGVGVARKLYQRGGHVRWIDFGGRKWYIEKVFMRDNSYYGDSVRIWTGDSTDMYKQIYTFLRDLDPARSNIRVNEKTANRLGATEWLERPINDTVEFIAIQTQYSQGAAIDGSQDSVANITQYSFYGCPVAGFTTLKRDSTLRPEKKKVKQPIKKQLGSNFSSPLTDSSLITHMQWMRNYYGISQNGADVNYLSIDTNGNINTQKFNFISAGQDSLQRRVYGLYNFWVLQGGTAAGWKANKDGGECVTHCNVHPPINGPDLNYRDTANYSGVRRFWRQLALVYGPTGGDASSITPENESQRRVGRGQVWGFQVGNEGNKTWFEFYENPMILAVKTWIAYEGIQQGDSAIKLFADGIANHPLALQSYMYLVTAFTGRTDAVDVWSMHRYSSSYKTWPMNTSDPSSNGLRKTGMYPAGDSVLRFYNDLHDMMRREIMYDTIPYIIIGEFGKDKRQADVAIMQYGGVSATNRTQYGVQKYDNLDSTLSHAYDVNAERMDILWSRIDGSCQFAATDYESQFNGPIEGGDARYAGDYVSSGYYNPFTNTRWPLYYREKNLVNLFGDFVPDSVLSAVNLGPYVYRARHSTDTDSLLVIAREGDTLSSNISYNIPAYGAASGRLWTLSNTNFTNTSTTVSATSDLFNSTLTVIPKYYTWRIGFLSSGGGQSLRIPGIRGLKTN